MEIQLYILHKNKKNEWGMWKEYYKGGTAVYWQAATKEQLSDINWYLNRTDIGHKRKKQYFNEYIEKIKKIYQSASIEPTHFNIGK